MYRSFVDGVTGGTGGRGAQRDNNDQRDKYQQEERLSRKRDWTYEPAYTVIPCKLFRSELQRGGISMLVYAGAETNYIQEN